MTPIATPAGTSNPREANRPQFGSLPLAILALPRTLCNFARSPRTIATRKLLQGWWGGKGSGKAEVRQAEHVWPRRRLWMPRGDLFDQSHIWVKIAIATMQTGAPMSRTYKIEAASAD